MTLRRQIHVCGAFSLVFYALLAVLSYAPIAHGLTMLGFLLVMIVTTVSPIWLAARSADSVVSARDTRLALYYATVFGVICACATTIFGRDFWYYLAQGRHVAWGGNVFTEPLTAAALTGLGVPTQFHTVTMPYGPAWVWISHALSSLTAPRIPAEFAAYKTVMFCGWLLTLRLVAAALAADSVRQLRSILVLGWLPLTLVASVGDAHNDIVMVALLTVWLVSGTALSTWPLVASTLVKYASAPLVGVAVLEAIRRRSYRVLAAIAAASLAALVVVLVYWQDGALVRALSVNLTLSVYTPVALGEHLRDRGILPGLATGAIMAWRLLLLGGVAWYAWSLRAAEPREFRATLSAAVFLAIMFTSSYIQTHYMLWVMPCLLLSSDRLLPVMAAPYILLFPFMQVLRVSAIGMGSYYRLTVVMHALLAVYAIAYIGYRLLYDDRKAVRLPVASAG